MHPNIPRAAIATATRTCYGGGSTAQADFSEQGSARAWNGHGKAYKGEKRGLPTGLCIYGRPVSFVVNGREADGKHRLPTRARGRIFQEGSKALLAIGDNAASVYRG